jgi:(p)ppGpp synthase/HD superfamily hydrolase
MKLTTVTHPELTRAIAIAVEAHSGAQRKNGQPYITHPLAVMDSVETLHQKIAAVLHDVVEDTSVTLEDLRNYGISERHVDMVDALSRREGETYMQFLERVKSAGEDVSVVKIADMEHNLNDNPSDAKKYRRGLDYMRNDG